MARGPVYPEILQEFGLGTMKGSYFFTVAAVASLLANLLSRWWLPRWGTFRSLKVFVFLQVLGSLGMGASGDLNHGFFWLLVSSFVFGLSLGGLSIVMNLLVVEASPPVKRGRYLSGLHMMYGVAALSSPLLVAQMLETWSDWSFCFYLLSIGPFLLFIYTAFQKTDFQIQRERKERKPLSATGWGFVLALSFCVGAEMAVSTRMVVYLRTDLQWDVAQSSLYLSYFFAGLMLGRMIKLIWHIPFSDWTVLVVTNLLTLLSYSLGLFYHPLGLSLSGFFMAVVFPTIVDAISKASPKEAENIVASGITGISIVLIIVHWVLGLLADVFTMRWAMVLGPALLVVVLLILFKMKSQMREQNGAT